MIYLDGERVDIEPNPKDHKFVGVFHKAYQIPTTSVMCSCGSVLEYQQETYEHYLSGHWDIPQYQSLEAKE